MIKEIMPKENRIGFEELFLEYLKNKNIVTDISHDKISIDIIKIITVDNQYSLEEESNYSGAEESDTLVKQFDFYNVTKGEKVVVDEITLLEEFINLPAVINILPKKRFNNYYLLSIVGVVYHGNDDYVIAGIYAER